MQHQQSQYPQIRCIVLDCDCINHPYRRVVPNFLNTQPLPKFEVNLYALLMIPHIQERLTSAKISAAAALALLLGGFVAMNIFWFSDEHDPNLLGLYDFKSATYGDAVALPLLLFLLVRLGQWQVKRTLRRNLLLAICGILGICAGVISQWMWLQDDDIILNWTLPQAGQFNAAGYYHAAFLALTVGLFMVVSVQAFVASRDHLKSDLPRIPIEYPLCIIVIPLFPTLHAIDFHSPESSVSSVVFGVAPLCLLPFLLVALVAWKWRIRGFLVATISGVWVLAVPLTILFYPAMSWPQQVSILLLACWAANFALPSWGFARGWDSKILTVLLFSTSWVLGIAFQQIDSPAWHPIWSQSFTMTCLAIAFVWVAQRMRITYSPPRLVVTETIVNSIFAITTVAFGLWISTDVSGPSLDGFIVLWSISIISSIQFISRLFRRLMRAEDNSDAIGKKNESIRTYQWGAVTGVIVISILIMAEAPTFNRISHTYSAETMFTVMIHTIVMVALWLFWVLIIRIRFLAQSVNAKNVAVYFLPVAMVGTAISNATYAWRDIVQWHNQPLVLLTVVLPLIAVVAMIYTSIQNNVYYLRGKPSDPRSKTMSLLISLSCACLASNALTILLSGRAQITIWGFGVLLLFLSIFTTRITVPPLRLRSNDHLNDHWVKTGPRAALLQDSFLVFLMFIFVAIYPAFSLMHHPDLATSAVRLFAFVGIVASVYGWMLTNNSEHARKYDPEYPFYSPPTQSGMPFQAQELWVRIRRHTRSQNILSAIMVLPVIPYLIASSDVESLATSLFGDE